MNETPPKIPLWVNHSRRELRWDADNGPIAMSYPAVMSEEEIADFEQIAQLAIRSMRRTAERISAQSAKDESP